jgi:CheY-like chemotaxis protein
MSAVILVVDDEAIIRSVLNDALSHEGYLVMEASNGREALEIIAEVTPRGMLVDLHMPVMDGLSLIRELQQRQIPIPCIVATAAHNPSDALSDLPIDALIPKPFDIDDVLAAVREHCGLP